MSKYKLVEVTREELLALLEVGAWCQVTDLPLLEYRESLLRRESLCLVDRGSDLLGDAWLHYLTRVEQDADQ